MSYDLPNPFEFAEPVKRLPGLQISEAGDELDVERFMADVEPPPLFLQDRTEDVIRELLQAVGERG